MTFKLKDYISLPEHITSGGFDYAAIHRSSARMYVAHTANDADVNRNKVYVCISTRISSGHGVYRPIDIEKWKRAAGRNNFCKELFRSIREQYFIYQHSL